MSRNLIFALSPISEGKLFPPLPGTFAPFRNETPEPVYHGGSFLRDTCAKAMLGLSPVPADLSVGLEDRIRERRLFPRRVCSLWELGQAEQSLAGKD